MPEPKDDRVSKTYQEPDGDWVTEDYGRVREATSEEIEEKLEEYEQAERRADEQLEDQG